MSTVPRTRRAWYKLLHQTHLWAGIVLCLPLMALGISGSILVADHLIQEWTAPAPTPPTAGEPKPLAEVIEAARANLPAGQTPSAIMFPEEAGQPITIRFAAARPAPGGERSAERSQAGERPQGGDRQPGSERTGGERQGAGARSAGAPAGGPPMGAGGPMGPGGGTTVRINPVTLDIHPNPAMGRSGFIRTMHDLHGNLLIPGREGREVVGWLGVVMLVLGVSGVVMWWPRAGRWKAAFLIGKGAKGLRLHRELHGAAGIWSLLVFMLVSVSGVYLVFPQTLTEAVSVVSPAREPRSVMNAHTVEPVRGTRPAGVEEMIAIAREAVPDAALRGLFLPTRPNQPARATLVLPDSAHGAPGITAFIDPWKRSVIEVRDPRTYSAGDTIVAWQRPLHAGEGLGIVWAILVFASGILPPLFCITGIAMWWIKRRNRQARRLDAAAAGAS